MMDSSMKITTQCVVALKKANVMLEIIQNKSVNTVLYCPYINLHLQTYLEYCVQFWLPQLKDIVKLEKVKKESNQND